MVVAMGKTNGHVKLKELPTTLTCSFSPRLRPEKVPKGCKLISLV